MTVPDRFAREADVPAGEESTVPVSETADASPAIAVTPADPALGTRLAIRITGLPPGTLVLSTRTSSTAVDGHGRRGSRRSSRPPKLSNH
jgi:hypothetical protein